MRPPTPDILGRSLRFGFNMNMTVEHARLMAEALNKAGTTIGGQPGA